MKKIILLCLLAGVLAAPLSAAADVTQNDRLLQRPEWDGAVISNNWIEGSLRFQSWDIDGFEFDAWLLGPTFMTSLPNLPALELGARMALIHFDPDFGSSETGVTDIDIWGKYQFYKTHSLMLSGGLLLTLPTGSDDIIHPSASGEVNVEVFAAGRYQADRRTALIGHFFLRKNSDADIDGGGELDGELQAGFGVGAIYEMTRQLNLIGQFNFATEAYEDMDNFIQLTGGAEFKVNSNFSLRGGLGLGLDDGAPEFELMIAAAFTF
jgi:opacity protein-like surface antigen